MKRIVKLFSLVLVLIGATSSTIIKDKDPESEKSKTYTKTYAVSSGDKIILDNSFGEMKIATWSRNEIKVDISMTATANTDQRAQDILDMISIEDSKKGSEVSFKTHIKDGKGITHYEDNTDRRDRKNRDDDRTNFKINYTVFLPNNMALNATNQFGRMSIGDYDGATLLASKFGNLTTGKLNQCKKVTVEFGSGTIESLSDGKLSVSFSKVQVNKLSGDIDASFNQAHGVKLVLDNNLKSLDINNNFSTLYLDADKNLSASFNVKSSFGNFSNKTGFTVTKNEERNKYYSSSQSWTGKSGSGNIPVTIKSSFGHVTLGHDISFDINEKSSRPKRDRA
jgi:hypothetical protein